MPAIEIARLRMQMDRLVALCHQPERCLAALHDLFEFYNDLTYRPGHTRQVQSLLPHYRVPAPIIRQLEFELSNFSLQDKEAGLKLADALWADSYLEPRLLAIHIIGSIPASPPEPVVTRLTNWAQAYEDRVVLDALIKIGTRRLLSEQTQVWSDMVKTWLSSTNLVFQSMGLNAMLVTVEDHKFQNLPVIFQLVSASMQNLSANLQPDLLALLQALSRRSPSETAYFFHQVLTVAHNQHVPRLVRRCFPFFSEETQDGLRQALKSSQS